MDPSSSTNTFDPWGEIDDSSESLLVARHIKDPIHNYIPISAKLSRFIDTRQFQRLRLIKQLGTTSYVWPSASHTRFEHCLGVAYLARQMAMHIQHSQPELGITDRDVDCVEIAGLCHDLGHGPWSHVWDGMFIPVALKDVTWQHEIGSEMMFDALIDELNAQVRKENELKEIQRKGRQREERRRKQHLREEYRCEDDQSKESQSQSIDDQDEEDEDKPKKDEPIIPPEDQAFIKALIAGDHSRTPQEKPFFFDIVANKRNGLDVDKFDYIHRDSHMIGEPISLSLVRLVNSARVLDDQICYDIKDANHIYDICVARFKLHKSIYNHKAAKAIEYMIIDALLLAEPHLKIAERVLDAKKYLHLTDDIMSFIEASEDAELAPARAIFDRIRARQLYKCVDFKVIDWPMRHLFREHVTPKRVVEECNRILKERAAEAAAGSPSGSASGPSSKGPSTPTPSMPLNELMEAEAEVGSTGSSTEMGEREFELELEGEGEEGQGEGDGGHISISDVIVDFSTMHYGMKDKNPVDSVRFYSKRLPKKSMEAGPGEYSNLRPQYFAEDLLRVYTKDPKNVWLVQAGYRAVLEQLQAEVEEKEKEKAKGIEKEKEALHLSPPSNVATASAPSSLSSLVAVGSRIVATAAVGLPPATAPAPTPPAPTPPATEAPSTPTASVSATHSWGASFSFGFSLAPAYASPSPLSLGTKAEGSFSSLFSDASTVVAAGAGASVPATAGATTTSSSHTATSTTTTAAGTVTTIATTGHSHSASALAPGSASAAPASATSTPFGPNKFMTVPPSYAPPSPTRSGKKAKVKTTLTQRGVGGDIGGVGGSGAAGGTGDAGGGRSTSTSRKRPRESERDENPVPVGGGGGASGVSAKRRR